MVDTVVKVKLANQHARMPEFKKKGDAGADIHAVEQVTIGPAGTAIVRTGLHLEMENGWEAQVRSRSGLAAKHGLHVLNSPGTIDAGYRGEIKVILHNSDLRPYTVNVNDRIAQLVFKRTPVVQLAQVEELGDSERGEGGLGSTGK